MMGCTPRDRAIIPDLNGEMTILETEDMMRDFSTYLHGINTITEEQIRSGFQILSPGNERITRSLFQAKVEELIRFVTTECVPEEDEE